ncbi:MAG: tRNA pseudouridine(38-40) synthase TruA [Clostridiales bacterium]|nr:tRNA pseudouridine(38-40) synthase TruA [Clostridiales bacterium]
MAKRRYFLQLAYRGALYHGWQSQPNAVTVQSELERALSLALRCETPIVGAGRTDAGVNASMMLAHFDAPEELDKEKLLRAVNSMVGRDISVSHVHDVPLNAHARFDATSRTYHYHAITTKSPFLYNTVWKAPAGLDFELMNEAASMLLEVDDFTSFSKLHTDTKTNLCDVREASWRQLTGERWCFVITADRFLRNMVRAVVGTLVDVGRHKITLSQFTEIIESKDRCAAGTSMPGEALFLHRVEYPYLQHLTPAEEP